MILLKFSQKLHEIAKILAHGGGEVRVPRASPLRSATVSKCDQNEFSLQEIISIRLNWFADLSSTGRHYSRMPTAHLPTVLSSK